MTQHNEVQLGEPMSGTIGDPEETKKTFWKELASNPVVMIALHGSNHHAEPMTCVLDEDANSKFWFYTSKDNRIASGGKAMAQFVSKGHDVFACIMGNLVQETDLVIIDKYWSNPVESWYAQGREDPKLLMLRFELEDAEIWIPDMSITGIFKLMTGKTMKTGDMGDHAEVKL